MNLLDLYENHDPRRIENLESKMDEYARAGLNDKFQKAKTMRDSYLKMNEAGFGQDLVTPQQRVKQSQPQKQTPIGKAVDTVKQAGKWLAGKGGPGKEGPTYEGQKKNSKEVAEAPDSKDPSGQIAIHDQGMAIPVASKYVGDGQFKVTIKNKPYIVTVAGFEIDNNSPGNLDSFYLTDVATGKTEHVTSGWNYPEAVAIFNNLLTNQLPALKEIYKQDMEFYEKHGWNTGNHPDRLQGLDKTVRSGYNAIPADRFVKAHNDMKKVTGQDLDEKKLGQLRPKLGSTRDVGKSVKKFRTQRGLDESQQLHVGDPIIVTAPNEFEGKTGEIAEFSPSGKFIIVNLYNHGEQPMHLSDVEYNQYADDEDEIDEGWSDAVVAQRTGQPRTPYSVYIKGKKWKDFENDDHAEAVANKLRAKFKAEGRDPSVITIAATDYDKMAEEQKPAGWGEFPPKQEITIVPPKKLKSGETYQDRNKYWQSQGQAPIYKTNEVTNRHFGPKGAGTELARQIRANGDTNWVNDLSKDQLNALAGPRYPKRPKVQVKKNKGVTEDADQVKKVFKDKAGKPVGEIGIDPESSPGNGEWYVHHYATGYNVVGFDSVAEAKRELMYVHKHPEAVEGHESTQDVAEGAMSSLHAEMGEVYRKLAPKIERHRDSYLAGQLYDELEAVADAHGAGEEFTRMMRGARNRAHMDYDTNPGGFQNWFWYLPFDDEQVNELNKNTLGNYVKANANDQVQHASHQSFKSGQAGDKYNKSDAWDHRTTKREKGMDRAVRKLTTEEAEESSPVEQAIIRRIMVAHTDLLKQFGPEKVMQAAEEVAYNVGDVDEIGTSDVSAYVNQVRQILGAEA